MSMLLWLWHDHACLLQHLRAAAGGRAHDALRDREGELHQQQLRGGRAAQQRSQADHGEGEA